MIRILLALLLLLAGATAADAQESGLAGRLHAIDGGTAEGVQVTGSCGGWSGSLRVDSTGAFSLLPECPAGAQPTLAIEDPEGRYLPSRSQARSRESPGRLDRLLVPRFWTIRSGTHAGTTVPVDLAAATTPACRDCSAFYFREDGDTLRSRSPGIPAWLEHSLPLRVAFDHEEGARVTPRDSAAFMEAAFALEADLGRRWFRPAQLEDIFNVPDGDPFGSLIVSIDPLLSSAGRGNWAGQGGEILAGIVYLQSARHIHDPRSAGIVAHEIMHTLGFGHTCSWRSVMANQSCPGRRASAPTAEDVAHAQLLIRLRTLERKFGIYGTVREAGK